MPIYEYKCGGCGGVHEKLVFDFNAEVVCPVCGGKMERLFSSSFSISSGNREPGTTCCGRTERCDTPPCSTGDVCRRE
ncbi:MAG: zinc ribbon domain-containing protein [Dehalococcoidales bacterium]|nr:zinc ribbon domain-containing protein [Dehalococcoidales bacterium]